MPQGYGGRKHFFEDYDKWTVGQILKEATKGDDDFREKILAHERKTKCRDAIVVPLVNWNS